MKKTTWFALGAFALVLIAFLVSQNIESAPVETPVPTEAPALRILDDQEITKIEYADIQGVSIILDKVEGLTWTSPTDPEAQITAGNIEELLSYFSELRILSILPEDSPAENFGLNEPAFTLTFFMEDGSTYQLIVGDPTPMSDGYYTWIDKKEMVVLPITTLEYIPTFMYYITTPPIATPDLEPTQIVTPTP